jgi:hypothetical protein
LGNDGEFPLKGSDLVLANALRASRIPAGYLPAGIIVAGGILSFCVWTLPNWQEFWSHVSQFPNLWQVPANQLLIIALTAKILSPLFLTGMIGIAVWIWYLVRPEILKKMARVLGPTLSIDTGHHDPLTPIPPTLLDTNTSKSPDNSTYPLISIFLLKEITILINVPGGKPVAVPLASNVKKAQMLAYIAWRQGELVDRDKLLEQIFGWRVPDEEATPEKLAMRFDTHKKLLRREIRKVVVDINKKAGREIIHPDIDLFVRNTGFWQLADFCRVEDLALIDECSKVMTLGRNEGKVTETIPEEVKDACEQLLRTYSGDFLASLIGLFREEFSSWNGKSSWVRKPFTLYRDAYLEALWLLGQHCAFRAEQESDQSQQYYAKAAKHFKDYALHACNSRLDTKVFFGNHGEYGERVGMSERAMRRCVVLFGLVGETHEINRAWSAYTLQMKTISEGRWKPSQETLDDVEQARAQTGAYRFSTQQIAGGETGE